VTDDSREHIFYISSSVMVGFSTIIDREDSFSSQFMPTSVVWKPRKAIECAEHVLTIEYDLSLAASPLGDLRDSGGNSALSSAEACGSSDFGQDSCLQMSSSFSVEIVHSTLQFSIPLLEVEDFLLSPQDFLSSSFHPD